MNSDRRKLASAPRRVSTHMLVGVATASLFVLQSQLALSEDLATAGADAIHSHATHRMGDLDIDAAVHVVEQSRSGYLPNLSFQAQDGKLHTSAETTAGTHVDTDTSPRGYGLTVTENIFDGFKTSHSVQRDLETLAAAKQQLLSTDQSLLLDVISTYVEVVRQQTAFQLFGAEQRVMADKAAESSARVKAGLTNEADRFEDEAAKSNAEAKALTASAKLRSAMAKYASLTGHEPGPLALPELPLRFLPGSLPMAIGMAQRQHPDLAAAWHTKNAADEAVGVARAGYMPTIDLNGTVKKEYDPVSSSANELTTATASIQLSFPIYQGGATTAGVKRAQSLASKQQVAFDYQRQQIVLSVTQAWEQFNSDGSVERALAQEVKAADKALASVQKGAEIGERSNLELNDARSKLLDAKNNLFNAQCDRLIDAYKLISAMGTLRLDHIETASAPHTSPQITAPHRVKTANAKPHSTLTKLIAAKSTGPIAQTSNVAAIDKSKPQAMPAQNVATLAPPPELKFVTNY